MSLEITGKTANPLLGRTRIEAKISFPGKTTPSNAETLQQLATAMHTDQKLVKVRHIYTDYRKNTATVKAYVYNSEDELKKTEIIPRKVRRETAKKAAEERKKAYDEKKAAAETKTE